MGVLPPRTSNKKLVSLRELFGRERGETNGTRSKVLHGILDSLNIDLEAFDNLTREERILLIQSLEELANEGQSITAESLWAQDYRNIPVSCEQFLTDPYFLGNESTHGLFPAWKQALIDIFDTDERPMEWILGGAIGTGKSTAASLAMTYVLYELSCLLSPHRFFGLMPGAPIVLGIYSITMIQASDTTFSKIQSYIDNSPYFQENMPRLPRKARIAFAKSKIQVIVGSRPEHAIGKDVYAFMLDEVNFLKAPRKNAGQDEVSVAYSLYNNARDRLKSRFTMKGGRVPGIIILVSSKKTRAAFLEQHTAAVRDDISAGRTRLDEYNQWEVRKHLSIYVKPPFRVEVGDQFHQSRILPDGAEPRPGAQAIEVPGEFRPEFNSDCDQALRDIAGIATFGITPLIHDKRILFDVIDEKLVHPFKREQVTLDITKDVSLDDYFDAEKLFTVRHSHYKMRLAPQAPRYVHVDIGLTADSLGIAMVHINGFKEVIRVRPDGTHYTDRAPVAVVDFMLRVVPPRGSEIDLAKVRSFLISLRDMGVPILRVSYDGFNSRDSMQIMRKCGFDAILFSVDRNDEPYLALRQAVVEKRIAYYKYTPFINEMVELERDIDKRKVDHPNRSSITGMLGSKDVSDAVCGAVVNALTDVRDVVPGTDDPGIPTYIHDNIRTAHGAIPWDKLDREAKR